MQIIFPLAWPVRPAYRAAVKKNTRMHKDNFWFVQ
jgi:hypothetical protein